MLETSNTLMLSLADSPARTFPALAADSASTLAPALGFGRKCLDSFAIYGRDSRSWRTFQLCLIGWMEEESQHQYSAYLETWPRSGLMRNGTAFRRDSLADIAEIGCSLSPTLCARDYRGTGNIERQRTRRNVSDICDGGGTFIGIADAMKDYGLSLGLYVTHGIFSKGFSDLSARFPMIYSSNSLGYEHREHVKIFDALPLLLSA